MVWMAEIVKGFGCGHAYESLSMKTQKQPYSLMKNDCFGGKAGQRRIVIAWGICSVFWGFQLSASCAQFPLRDLSLID